MGNESLMWVTRIDEHAHEYRSAIWIASLQGGEARRFTRETRLTDSPAWSPDGNFLAFVAVREAEAPLVSGKEANGPDKLRLEKPQVWVMPTDGGEARQLTWMEHGASAPVWSPDSKQILFRAQVGPVDEESEEGKPVPKVRVIDRLWYRLDGVGFIHERRSHLFLIDGMGGQPRQLTDGDWDDADATWSPDGSQIVFTSNQSEDRWRLPGADLYVMPVEAGTVGKLRCLTDGTLSCGSPSWSPDGKTIAFLASTKRRSAGQVSLYTIAAGAEGTVATCLSKEFEGTCMDLTTSDIGDDALMPPPAWSLDSKTLYVLASQRGASRLYALGSSGAGTQLPTLTPGEVHVRDFSIDQGKSTLALLVADPTRPQEIFVRLTDPSGEMQRLTTTNDALLEELTHGLCNENHS
jgi:Tol biopolymer transport system component